MSSHLLQGNFVTFHSVEVFREHVLKARGCVQCQKIRKQKRERVRFDRIRSVYLERRSSKLVTIVVHDCARRSLTAVLIEKTRSLKRKVNPDIVHRGLLGAQEIRSKPSPQTCQVDDDFGGG